MMVTDRSARATCRKKRKKKATTTQVAPAKNMETTQAVAGKQQQLVCRFISMGSGIDLNARKQLDELLVSIEKNPVRRSSTTNEVGAVKVNETFVSMIILVIEFKSCIHNLKNFLTRTNGSLLN
ncbi:MAG: hypothetical protein HWD58_21765 [Bacteroidota bacterium]|nr:MAG: hypothetical protein HWD58_21765 [Bacteroidota bacterium]